MLCRPHTLRGRILSSSRRKIKSVEFMACDALALAAGPLGLREALCEDADLQVIQQWLRAVAKCTFCRLSGGVCSS